MHARGRAWLSSLEASLARAGQRHSNTAAHGWIWLYRELRQLLKQIAAALPVAARQSAWQRAARDRFRNNMSMIAVCESVPPVDRGVIVSRRRSANEASR